MKVKKWSFVFYLIFITNLLMAGPSIVGSMQGWDPADPTYELNENANGVWELTKTLSAGNYQYKVVEGDTWGAPNWPENITLDLAEETDITWKVNLDDDFVFHSPNPPIVVGDFQDELGGNDWDVSATDTQLLDDGQNGDEIAGDDIYTFQTVIPAGDYQYKVALNNSWNQNTGGNIAFSSDGSSTTRFTYDMSNNTTLNIALSPPEVVSVMQYNINHLQVLFNTSMDTTSTTNPANYTIDNGAALISGEMISPTTVRFETSDLTSGTTYTIEASFDVKSSEGYGVSPFAGNNSGSFTAFEYAPITFVIVDTANARLNDCLLKGSWIKETGVYDPSWDNGATEQMYDDGTHGDVTPNDNRWSRLNYLVVDSTQTWEWGAEENGNWLISGDNPQFFVDDDSAQTLEYILPFVDQTTQDVTVTFQVDMNFQTINGDVTIAGDFNGWNGTANLMSDPDNDSIYTAEILYPAGSSYEQEYKFINSGSWENMLENRLFTIDDSDTTQVLDAVYFNNENPTELTSVTFLDSTQSSYTNFESGSAVAEDDSLFFEIRMTPFDEFANSGYWAKLHYDNGTDSWQEKYFSWNNNFQTDSYWRVVLENGNEIQNGQIVEFYIEASDYNGPLILDDNSGENYTVNVGDEILTAPENVQIEIIDGDAHISWNEVIGAEGYNVYRSTTPDGTFTGPLNGLNLITEEAYIDENIGSETKYFYYIKTVY